MDKALAKVEKLLKIYHFKNDLGETINFTPGQKQIMAAIVNHGIGGKNRVQVETPTQYGKSSAIAAALTMICTKQEKWSIVAGTGEKAQIIMDYFIDFSLDNPISKKLLDIDVPLDRLKRERNRRELNFMSGFGVRVFSADARNKQSVGNSIMGFGSPFVLLDEAALVDDMIESKVVRMLVGYSTTKNLLVKIGNPFYRNHFWKTHNDPDYHLIWIDYKQALLEGRFTEKAVEEARKKPDFGVLYETKFPAEGDQDSSGWLQLFTESELERAQIDDAVGFGGRKLGVDVASEGRNESVIVERYTNLARILKRSHQADTMFLVEDVLTLKDNPYKAYQILVDKVGSGKGCYDLLNRQTENVVGVNAGLEPLDHDQFYNLRAEMFWRIKEWIAKGGKLVKDEGWGQLLNIKYKRKLEGSKGKLIIMGKDEMLKNGIQSPDVADALSLTFAFPDIEGPIEEENKPKEDIYDKYGLFNSI